MQTALKLSIWCMLLNVCLYSCTRRAHGGSSIGCLSSTGFDADITNITNFYVFSYTLTSYPLKKPKIKQNSMFLGLYMEVSVVNFKKA